MSIPPQWCLGFVFDDDNEHVMLGIKSKGFHVNLWNGVGGNLEGDESPLDAMRREAFEETGKELLDWHSIGEVHGPRENPWKIYVFYTKSDVRSWIDQSQVLNYGIGSFRLIRRNNLVSYLTAPHTKQLIRHAEMLMVATCDQLVIREE